LTKGSGITSDQSQEPQSTEDRALKGGAEACDDFLRGLKLIEIPEGKELLTRREWLDDGFYDLNEYTEATTIVDRVFKTDVPGVQGFERLSQMNAVSQAHTPLLIKYTMVAYQDKTTGIWRVFVAQNSGLDLNHEADAAAQGVNDVRYSSLQSNYASYGHWALAAGRIREAKQALLEAETANPYPSDRSLRLDNAQIQQIKTNIAMQLDAISRIAGE
jgi:hypothetical protein